MSWRRCFGNTGEHSEGEPKGLTGDKSQSLRCLADYYHSPSGLVHLIPDMQWRGQKRKINASEGEASVYSLRKSPCQLSKRILIVDDLELVRKVIRDFLENESEFEVCGEAVDGRDAIQKAQDLNPDLIILDLAMPRMNGIEAARLLKMILPKTLILMLTSHDPLVFGATARAAGIDAVVIKDGDMASLMGRLQILLQEPRQDVL